MHSKAVKVVENSVLAGVMMFASISEKEASPYLPIDDHESTFANVIRGKENRHTNKHGRE